MDQQTSLADALRRFNANKSVAQPMQAEIHTIAEGIMPQNLMALDLTDPNAILKARLAQMMLTIPEVPEESKARFHDVPDFNINLQIVERDFPDNKYLEEEGFYVYKADIDFLVTLGRTIMPMLSNGFTTHGVVGLLILAYNLRAPHTEGEEEIFDDIDPEISLVDTHGDTVINVQYSGSPATTMYAESNNPINDAIYYCYVAASTIRLFTKSVDNYIEAWTNINNRFIGFYGFSPPVAMMPPTKEALTGLHAAFQSDHRMKMSLYKILYSARREPRWDGIRRFLYEIHLANTGLHVVGIFAQLCLSLNVESRTLLQVLYTKEFEKQVSALAEMTRMMRNNGTEYSRRMWRFGRVFSENFMSSLQTNACPKFVYILASMIKTEDPAKCKNILNIVQIKDLTEAVKHKCAAVGHLLLGQIRNTTEQIAASSSSGWADATSILITGHKLNGLNYLQWRQSIYMFICGKGKDDYLIGDAPAPAVTDPTYRKWKAENNMVMSWLINSMTTDIGENFLLYQTAQDIWEAAKETYSTQEKSAEIFEVESLLQDLKQGNMLVHQYYNSLTKYWQKLDLLETYSWSCPADAANFKKITEQKRLYKFLLGLSDMFEDVRSRILGRTVLPSLKEAFSEIRREESRKKLSQGTSITNPLEHSALVARGNEQRTPKQGNTSTRPWCDHCRKKGHTWDTCWQLHGKPANWKPRQQGSIANNAATLPTVAPFSQEQLDLLQKLFVSNPTPSTGKSSNFSFALTTASQPKDSWIVDFGASDHMTGHGIREDDWQC